MVAETAIGFKRRALCIGAKCNLQNTERDAKEIHRRLVDPTLGCCEEQASKLLPAIEKQGDWQNEATEFFDKWSSDDLLIFYFSGHGNFRNGKYHLQFGQTYKEYVPINAFWENLASWGVRRAILILDACYAGAAKSGGSKIQEISIPEEGWVIFASSGESQISDGSPDHPLSLFTSHLCDVLDQGNATSSGEKWLALEHLRDQINARLKSRPSSFGQECQLNVKQATGSRFHLSLNKAYGFQNRSESGNHELRWERLFLRLPIEIELQNRLQSFLDELQLQVVAQFAVQSRVREYKQLIRTNVFFPDYRNGTEFEPYVLCFGEHLWVGNYSDKELQIEFLPGQGATGQAFQTGIITTTLVHYDKRGKILNPQFPLTSDQVQQVSPDLQWIISIPIMVDNTFVAVLNVDGLFPVSKSFLSSLSTRLSTHVLAFAILLKGPPRVTLKLSIQDNLL